jgi:hypothetical protein
MPGDLPGIFIECHVLLGAKNFSSSYNLAVEDFFTGQKNSSSFGAIQCDWLFATPF